MKVVLAHRIEPVPNRQQAEFSRKAVGVARFAYNWALAEWQKQYEQHRQDPTKPHALALRREFNRIKRQRFPWVVEVPKAVPQQAIKNLGQAFQSFFRGKGRYPTFHKRGRNDSARMDTPCYLGC